MALNRKPVILRVWPEVIGYVPGLIRIKDKLRSPLSKIPKAIIDFDSVRRIDAVGATILTLRLQRFLRQVSSYEMQIGCPPEIAAALESYGVVDKLGTAIGSQQQSTLTFASQTPACPKVYWLHFSQYADRRDALLGFKKWLLESLTTSSRQYGIHLRQLVTILNEIAKNSADHTNGDAMCGIEFSASEDTARLNFAFGDLGVGIKSHIETNLPPSLSNRRAKLSLYEAYYYALKPGYTSRPGTLNKGVGMSLITEGAKALNLNLSVFDAESRGLLGGLRRSSHRELRTVFHSVGHDVGFFYHGEIVATKTA